MKVHTTSSRASYREFDGNEDWPGFNAVVSLHAHTHHSREVMACLPQYFAKIPLVGSRFERERQTALERTGDSFDFSKGWWHPPVGPRQVFESEVQQIEQRFGLSSIVSVTDHDDVAAGIELQAMYAVCRAPISFEWTVPYGDGFFHLGVHNLPPDDARAWFARLASFTAEPGAEPLGDLLADLHARPEMLVVFNHPMWDLADVGGSQHTRLLHHFLAEHRSTLHALELNGYRSGKENDRVRALAKSAGLPLISGGDRHGCAPNSLLNVTAAQSFAEFAEEIRAGVTHVVVMPEYRQHIVTRTLAAASDVLRRYPRHPVGRQHWTDRVSCDWGGSVRPLSFHWPHGGPLWVRSSVKAFQLITSPVLLPIIRVALETIDPLMHSDGMELPMSTKEAREYEAS